MKLRWGPTQWAVCIIQVGLCAGAATLAHPASAQPAAPDPEMQAMYAELLESVSHAAKLHRDLFAAQAKIRALEEEVARLKSPPPPPGGPH